MITWFLDIWRADDKVLPESSPDCIIALSYVVKRGALTNGTREVLLRVIEYWKKFPLAIIAFANSSHCFPGSDTVEEKLKYQLIDKARIPRSFVFSCGSAMNTVTEAEAICRGLQLAEFYPKNLLIVTGLLHSRGARFVWERTAPRYFKGVRIHIAVISLEYEYQKDHPLMFQRGLGRWIFANIARQAALRILGLQFVRKVHDPTIKINRVRCKYLHHDK